LKEVKLTAIEEVFLSWYFREKWKTSSRCSYCSGSSIL